MDEQWWFEKLACLLTHHVRGADGRCVYCHEEVNDSGGT